MHRSFINERLLFKIIPLIFLSILVFKLIYTYATINSKQKEFINYNSKILSKLIKEYTKYYQNHFSSTTELNEKNFTLFPSYSNNQILEKFSKTNNLKLEIKTHSLNPMNPKNSADKYEKKLINYFEQNPTKSEHFEVLNINNKKFYYYASVVKIELSCLKCHASKDDAPLFVSQNYSSGYGYKNGDIIGIVGIKSYADNYSFGFLNSVIIDLIYDILLLSFLFILAIYVLKHIKKNKKNLEQVLDLKNQDILKRNSELKGFINALNRSNVVCKMDVNGVITYANRKFCKISRFEKEEIIGKNYMVLIHPDMDMNIFQEMWDVLSNRQSWTKVIKWQNRDKKAYYTKTTITPIIDEDKNIKEFIMVSDNVSEFIEQKEHIRKILLTDKLTNLPNRTKLLNDITNCKNPNLALINIDKFREINDFYGFKAGDDLLLQVSLELSKIEQRPTIYKLPSDEFAIFLDRSDSFDMFVNIVRLSVDAIEAKTYSVKSQPVTLTVSTGISKSKYETLATADLALHHAKTTKQSLIIYQNSMNLEGDIKLNLKRITKVKNAIKTDNIMPYFQPIYNIRYKRIDKYEALIRLKEGDIIYSPYEFMEIAKRAKLYPQLTRIMIDKTFEKFKDSTLGFSINISIDDVNNLETVKFIKDSLSSLKNPQRVVFEILESEGFDSYTEMVEFIADIKKFGAQVAIDDFGSGYSNFSHLLKLNVDYLKIDASLVKNITKDDSSKILVKSIVYFTKSLKIKTVAEFVEDEETLLTLQKLGVDYAQGYYIGKPSGDLIV